MSEENVEAFKRATVAINCGDVEGLLAELHPEVELHAFMEELISGANGVYWGHAGVREFFRDFNEPFDELHWEYPDIRDLGDRVLAIGTFRARGRASGAEVETPLGVLVDYDPDGVATVVLSTADPRDALEAAGLSESAMSEENVKTTFRAFDMFNRQDLDGFLALMTEDVRVESRLAPIEGGYRGHDGVRRWWKSLFDGIPDYTLEVVEVRDPGDDLTLAQLHNRGHGTTSTTPFEETTWMAARWRRGKCVWWAVFLTQKEALEAAGLSE